MPAGTDLNLGRTARKAAGVFYTPDFIVDYILERTLARLDIVMNPAPAVLDPACGSGNFLVRAYDVLLAKLTEKLPELKERYANQTYVIEERRQTRRLDGRLYWCRENLHYHIVSHCLYGADVDQAAVALAQDRLRAKKVNGSELAVANLVVGDSLYKWESPVRAATDEKEDDQAKRLTDFWSRQYDCVVGNPPYVSFGLNRAGKMSAEQAAYLRANYPHSAQYKLSYYALFFERSIMALKPGGYLGFITPDSYLLGRYYSRIREYILRTCAVRELTLATGKVFKGVVVGIPAITVLQKNDLPLQPPAMVTISRLDSQGLPDVVFQYSQNYFQHQVYNRFRLFFSAQDKAIIEKMEQTPVRFADAAKIRTGMRSLTVQADIKSKIQKGATWRPGLTSSAQILPFAVVYEGSWLDVNPVKLNKGGWDAAVMAGAKILLRQTGDRLIAAVDRSGLYHLNNIHSLTGQKAEVALECLVCLLNSRLMNYYYHMITLEKGRSMAQVDIETVEKLPLAIDALLLIELAALGQRLEQLGGRLRDQGAGRTEAGLPAEFDEACRHMNQLVYTLYGLSEKEIEHVEQSEAAGLAKTGLQPKNSRGSQI